MGVSENKDLGTGAFDARFSGPIRPTVEAVVAEDDTVVVLWCGHATALDGVAYDTGTAGSCGSPAGRSPR